MSSAWKDLERRICRALGGERAGPRGRYGSDGDEAVPFALEVKRTTRYQLRAKWIEQARRQGKAEKLPWLLVIAEHGDRRPVAVLDFYALAEIAERAGLVNLQGDVE